VWGWGHLTRTLPVQVKQKKKKLNENGAKGAPRSERKKKHTGATYLRRCPQKSGDWVPGKSRKAMENPVRALGDNGYAAQHMSLKSQMSQSTRCWRQAAQHTHAHTPVPPPQPSPGTTTHFFLLFSLHWQRRQSTKKKRGKNNSLLTFFSLLLLLLLSEPKPSLQSVMLQRLLFPPQNRPSCLHIREPRRVLQKHRISLSKGGFLSDTRRTTAWRGGSLQEFGRVERWEGVEGARGRRKWRRGPSLAAANMRAFPAHSLYGTAQRLFYGWGAWRPRVGGGGGHTSARRPTYVGNLRHSGSTRWRAHP
jgi:hypothetical protein